MPLQSDRKSLRMTRRAQADTGLDGVLDHLFHEIALEDLREISYQSLVEISQLAIANSNTKPYESLRVAIQKLHWAKMSGTTAIELDTLIASRFEPGVLMHDPWAQMHHGRALLELVVYCKSALDSASRFITLNWSLGTKHRKLDFVSTEFRVLTSKAVPSLGDFLTNNGDWLDNRSRSAHSLTAARDEWIHRGAPLVALSLPPNELGVFPIPRTLGKRVPDNRSLSEHENYFSTVEFCQFHWLRALDLIKLILSAAIAKERESQPDLVVGMVSKVQPLFPQQNRAPDAKWLSLKIGPVSAARMQHPEVVPDVNGESKSPSE